jgi:hypothetical protein
LNMEEGKNEWMIISLIFFWNYYSNYYDFMSSVRIAKLQRYTSNKTMWLLF